MAYNGYLVKVGNYIIPNSFINLDSFEIVPDQRQDIDPYRDSNGKLHRKVVSNKPSAIRFSTVMLHRVEQVALRTGIKNNTSAAERKASVTYYNPDTDSYDTRDMYFPDVSYTINRVDDVNMDIVYNPINYELIGY